MKRAILTAIMTILLASASGARGAATEAAAASPWDAALALDLPGKGGWTTCYPFAKALQRRILHAGCECHLVIYDWTDCRHCGARHAFVVYRDAEGRYWGMDNRSSKPRWLAGDNALEWASFWDQDKTINRAIEDASGPTLAGGGASVSAAPVGFSP